VAFSFSSLLVLSVMAAPSPGGEALKPVQNLPVILTIFPPPEAPRDLNTNVVGLELAFAEQLSESGAYRLVHLSVKNQIHELAVKALEAIQRWNPVLIIGGSTSNAAFILSDLAETHQIPFITPWATHPRLTEKKKYTFRVCFDDNYQAVKLAEFAFNDEATRRAVILSNRKETFSIGVSDIFSHRFKSLGGQIVGRVDFADQKEIDEQQLEKIVSWKPDVVFIPSYEIEATAVMTRLVGRLPERTVFLGADAWSGSQMIQAVLERLKLQPKAFFVEHWSREFSSEGNKKFLGALKSKSMNFLGSKSAEQWLKSQSGAGVSASGVALGYDAGLVALEALRLQRKSKLSLVDALKKVDLEGATGKFKFRDSATPEKGLFIYSFEKEGLSFVKAFK
jgi:branched-chain amino acid transport system substrate-binding protein